MSLSTSDPSEGVRLSVVMPALNVEDWIAETVWSILNQSERSLELIVVDDGSTDGTIDLLAGFDDDRVRILKNPRSGGGSARNFGIAHARGEYLAFADADDIVPRRAYELLLDQAARTGSEMVIGNHLVFEPERLVSRQASVPLYNGRRERLTISEEPTVLRDRVCWNRIIKRTAWDELGLHFVDAKRSNDIRAMVDAYCSLGFDVIPEAVYIYRRRRGTTSMTSAKMQPIPLTEHLTQEWGCYESLRRLNNRDVLETYFRGILAHDLWAHTPPLFAPARLDDPAYRTARELTERLVRLAPESALPDNPAQRLPYRWLRAPRADWALAALFGPDSVDEPNPLVESPELAQWVQRSGGDLLLRRDTVRHLYVGPLVRVNDATPDEEVMRLFHRARRMCHVFGISVEDLSAEERHIMRARHDDVATVRRRAMTAGEIARARGQGKFWYVLRASDRVTVRRVLTESPKAVMRRVRRPAGRVARAMARRLPTPLANMIRTVVRRLRAR